LLLGAAAILNGPAAHAAHEIARPGYRSSFEEDISWWPSQARPPISSEQHFVEHGIGPADPPAPAAFTGTVRDVSTQAELENALAALNPGETIRCAAGIYNGAKTLNRSGTPGNRIKIRAAAGAEGGEVIFCDVYSEFLATPNRLWTQTDSTKNIWRTNASAYTAGTVGYHHAFVETPDGKLIPLIPYIDLATLSATDEGWTGEGTAQQYMGPGITLDGGRLHIRLSDCDERTIFGDFRGWLQPAGRNPNHLRLWISNTVSVFECDGVSDVEFHDIRFIGSSKGLSLVNGNRNVRVLRCIIDCQRYGIHQRFGDSRGLRVEFSSIRSHCGQWWPRSLHKREPNLYRSRTESVGIQFVGDGGSTLTNLTIRHSRITDFMDAYKCSSDALHHTHTITRNYIRSIDDLCQNSTATYNCEVAYNFVVGPVWGWQGAFTQAPVADRGKIYIHHNVIDLRWRMLFDYYPDEIRRVVRPLINTHNTTISDQTSFSAQIYNNTIIGGGAAGGGYDQAILMSWYGAGASPPEHWMNNIIVQTDVVGIPYRYIRRPVVTDGGLVTDGNIYHRQGQSDEWAQLWEIIKGSAKQFGTLAEFRADEYEGLTEQFYTPGWEAAGVEHSRLATLFTDFASGNLQPPNGGVADSTGVDLSAFPPAVNWPRNDSAFRGAIAPPEGRCSSWTNIDCLKSAGGW
jgi:hypothetical protein